MSKLLPLNTVLASSKRATGLLSVAVALALPLTTPTQVQAQVAAKAADSFVESIGVNTHFEYGTYSNYSGLKQKLSESGIRYVRDSSHPNSLAKLGELYTTHGIRTNMLLGRRFPGSWPQPLDLSQISAELADVKKVAAGAVVSLEAPNEYDIMQGPNETNWVGKIQQYTKDIYAKAKADATLKNLPVLGPSLTSGSAYSQVGNMDPWIDYANLHPYQSDRHPGSGGWGDDGYGSIYWHKKYGSSLQSPSGKPTQATECGYHNDVANDGLSEEAAGKYTARMYAEFFRTGFSVRSFKYELLNQGTGYKENVFGLLREDLTEKPSFRAVKNLISVLADKGAAFTPGSLDYTLTGSTTNVRQMLFQKRNGDFYLMLWLEVPSWDVNANKDLYPAAQSVTLAVPGTITSATKYELNNNSDMSTANVGISSGALSLSVSDKVMIVKLAVGKTVTPPPTTGTFSGVYKLTARHSGKALDVSEVSKADGAAVHQWDYVGGANQQWKIEATGNGAYTLTAQHSGKVLDVDSDGIGANGTQVQQWQYYSGSANQQWKIEATSDGYYKLLSLASGKALDINGGPGATGNGVKAIQWTYGGGTNQQWKLELVSAATAARAAEPAAAMLAPDAASVVSLSAFPNPSTGPTTLALEAKQAQRVTVYVHNAQGYLVSLLTVPCQQGHTDFKLPTDLSTGTYFLRALIDGQKQQFTLKVQ